MLEARLASSGDVEAITAIYNEGYQPTDSNGNHGIDPEGIVLVAYDRNGDAALASETLEREQGRR